MATIAILRTTSPGSREPAGETTRHHYDSDKHVKKPSYPMYILTKLVKKPFYHTYKLTKKPSYSTYKLTKLVKKPVGKPEWDDEYESEDEYNSTTPKKYVYLHHTPSHFYNPKGRYGHPYYWPYGKLHWYVPWQASLPWTAKRRQALSLEEGTSTSTTLSTLLIQRFDELWKIASRNLI